MGGSLKLLTGNGNSPSSLPQNVLFLFFMSFVYIKHLYTGPEYGVTGQSKTPSCQSGRLMIKQ